MAEYTEQEQEQVRRAVLTATAYASKADPASSAASPESPAGPRALAAATEGIRAALA